MVRKLVERITAKSLLTGMVKRAAEDWKYQQFRECAERQDGVEKLLQGRWGRQLAGLLQRHQSLRALTLTEFLSWVAEANPGLYQDLVQDPAVMSWLQKGWEPGKKALAETGITPGG